MRLGKQRLAHRRGSVVAAPVVAGVLALVASACGSTAPSSSTTKGSTGVKAAKALLNAGLAEQQKGNLKTAAQDYKDAIVQAPHTSTAAYASYDLGYIAQVNQNDPTAAANYYEAALVVLPKFVNALYNLAIVLTSSQPHVAEADYLKVIAIDPKNANAHLNLGFLYASDAKSSLAHKEFATATALEPSLATRIPKGS